MTSLEWDTFESVLLEEFRSILTEFKCIERTLSSSSGSDSDSDSLNDFNGLLMFILKDRQKFREVAAKEFAISYESKELQFNPQIHFDSKEFIKNVSNLPNNLSSFSPEFSKFHLLLNYPLDHVDLKNLIKLSISYWNNRYPSLKESFIIPLAAKLSRSDLLESPELVVLLKRRICKGKLLPFDQSISVAKMLELKPSQFFDGFFDEQLANLKEIIRMDQLEAKKEFLCVIQQLGCHCD